MPDNMVYFKVGLVKTDEDFSMEEVARGMEIFLRNLTPGGNDVEVTPIISENEYQTRNHDGACLQWDTLEEAFAESKRDISVWKISFQAEGGERIRLVRRTVTTEEGHTGDIWSYEPIILSEMIDDFLKENEDLYDTLNLKKP